MDEQAGLRHALPAAAIARWAASAGAVDAGSAEQPLYGEPAVMQRLPLGEELGEVVIVDARVGRAGQGQNPGPDWFSHSTPGGSSAVAVGQGGGALLPPAGKQPPEVTEREVQEPSGLPGE